MSHVFSMYSKYYNLLYQDKDYEGETNYVVQLINKYKPQCKNIVELGSGTGIHANFLAKRGYHIVGIERSTEMVEIANQIKHKNVLFQKADISNFEIDKHFDVALSLFHVISYLNNNLDLILTFKNVYKHLNKGGLFIFDVWHTPAVYSQVPEKRIKKLQDENISVLRNANPIINAEQNIVEVNYDIEVKDLKSARNGFYLPSGLGLTHEELLKICVCIS